VTLDIRGLPVIDDHVHMWGEEAGRPGFDPLVTVSLGGSDPEFLETGGHAVDEAERARLRRQLTSSLGYSHAVHMLARTLDCAPTAAAVQAARDAECGDFRRYVTRLYRDINLELALIDTGLGGADLDDFAQLSGVPCRGVYRIEPLLATLWPGHDDLDGFDRALIDGIRREVESGRYVSLKSIIAYRTGLAVDRPDPTATRRAFDEVKRARDGERAIASIKVAPELVAGVKRLRDHWLWLALELSIELGLPFQIHTGMGDQDLDINTARPGLLASVFRDERLRHARIVLLHGAYPFHEEAAYLVDVFPNVYLDLSEHNLFLGPNVAHVLRAVFGLAPSSKLLFGTDAYRSPDLQWIAARTTLDAMSTVLGELVDSGSMAEPAARDAAAAILAGNARELYGL